MRNDLTLERLRELLTYEPKTGVFRWLATRGRSKSGAFAGTRRSDGYIVLGVDRKLYLAQRLAWLATYGAFPSGDIDHIDGDTSNNRIENLRDVSRTVNAQNRRGSRNETGLMGVSREHSTSELWQARIRSGGKRLYIGTYATPELAHEAYLQAKRALHAGNTL